MKFGLSDNAFHQICEIFPKEKKIEHVLLFGSRALGRYKEGSDIDLAIKGKEVSFNDLLRLHVLLDDLNLPYQFDLVNFEETNSDLKDHINRVGIEIYSKYDR